MGFGSGKVDGAVDNAGVTGTEDVDEEKVAVVEGGTDEAGKL